MKFTTQASVLLLLASSHASLGFQSPVSSGRATTSLNLFSFGKKEKAVEPKEIVPDTKSTFPSFFQNKKAAVATVVEEDESWTDFGKDPLSYAYAASWAGLVIFAFFLAPGELSSASDSAMIQSIIDNPSAPDMNSFFYGIFNLFVLIPFVLACTIAPRASPKGIPGGPPLFLSAFIAYFVMGPYLALRKTPKDVVDTTDLGFWTKNVWENKIFNSGVVVFGLLCLASGAPGLANPAETFQGMVDLITSSRFASVSMLDLTLITLILTKEVADDYKIRCAPEDQEKAKFIGASTALLPILGSAIYCAARPSLLVEEEK